MRAITQKMVDAFWAGKSARKDNTEVCVIRDAEVHFYLHGNLIARRPLHGTRLEISCAGWQSNTTKERLNGLLRRHGGVEVIQERLKQHGKWAAFFGSEAKALRLVVGPLAKTAPEARVYKGWIAAAGLTEKDLPYTLELLNRRLPED